MTNLLSAGLIVPDVRDGKTTFAPSPLGRTVQAMLAAVDLPPHAIDDWRREEKAKIDAAVARKIEWILERDPEEDRDIAALERWARHGGPSPFSPKGSKEVARQFVEGVMDEIGDDPEMKQQFVDTFDRIAGKNGDDQEA